MLTGVETLRMESASLMFCEPRFAPAGNRLLYFTRPFAGGNASVWVSDTNFAAPRLLVPFGVALGEAAWSTDGLTVVLVRYDIGQYDLGNGEVWTVNVATGATTRIAGNP